MANKNYGGLQGQGGGKASGPMQGGAAQSASMPMKCPAYPGVPGKTQKSRSNGTATSGKRGPFYPQKVGL